VVTGGGAQPTVVAPHPIMVVDPVLTPVTGTGPFDTAGSTNCQDVAAAANGLDPANPGSVFQTQCLRVTWQLNGAPENVVTYFSTTTDGSLGPKVQVLTQDASGMWDPILESDGSNDDWSKATVSAANLTGSNVVDPEFVVNFHKNDGAQQMDIVQSNDGAPEVKGQTNEAFQSSLQIEGTKIVIFGSKTDGGDLRSNTVTWNSSEQEYFGLFNYNVQGPVPSSSL
jgi:hypothetical protein